MHKNYRLVSKKNAFCFCTRRSRVSATTLGFLCLHAAKPFQAVIQSGKLVGTFFFTIVEGRHQTFWFSRQRFPLRTGPRRTNAGKDPCLNITLLTIFSEVDIHVPILTMCGTSKIVSNLTSWGYIYIYHACIWFKFTACMQIFDLPKENLEWALWQNSGI